MLLSDLNKREVLDVNANKTGYLVDVDMNIPQGTINHFVLRTGLLKKVPLTADKIDRIGEKVLLKVSKEEVERTPAEVK